MANKTIAGLLMVVLSFGFIFSLPNISRGSILALKKGPGPTQKLGPTFEPGPNWPLGPSPDAKFTHPHMQPGPNEQLGPNPPELTPPHCPPGPNEPLGPHFSFSLPLQLHAQSFNHIQISCID